MSCAVYCIAPLPEQIERMVRRAKAAGISTRNIAVVIRDREEGSPRDALPGVHAWWPFAWYSASLLLSAPAVWPMLWWQQPEQKRRFHTVLSLTTYRAARRRQCRA